MHQLKVWAGQQALRQIPSAIDIRVLPQVDTGEVQQVEAHEYHRRFALGLRDLLGALEPGPVLKRIERGTPVAAERDDLAVENHAADVLRCQIRDELRKGHGQIDPPSRLETYGAVLHEGDGAVTIQLWFVEILVVRARRAADLGQHRRESCRHRFGRTAGREACRIYLRRAFRRGLLYGAAAKHRAGPRQYVVGLGVPVLVLEQEPLVGCRRAHQRKRSLQLLTAQQDAELALVETVSQELLSILSILEGRLSVLIG